MSASLVVALVAAGGPAAALAAGFEEEGVPLTLEPAVGGDAPSLARVAARGATLGLGIGADDQELALVLAAAPGCVYLAAPSSEARTFGHAAARVAARRPLRYAS